MKLIIFCLFLFSSTEIYAKGNLLLQCLAKEEEKIHKTKDVGALYKLNQNFLNEIASNNDISLKKNFVDEICNNKAMSPSVGFLHLLLIKESDIYDLSLSETDSSLKPFKMGYINEFQKQVPHLLITYLTNLQSEINDPKCLTNAIPEINYFTEKLKYLEDEISVHQILSDKKKIENIFNKLKNFAAIKKECNTRVELELQSTLKKNQQAKSTKN